MKRTAADTWVRLAAFQRVVRAQQLAGPGYLAHFSLLGLVTAGRDDGGRRFERESAAEHVRALATGLAATGLAPVQLALTPLSEAGEAIAIALPAELAGAPVEIVLDRERVAGRSYYQDLCYKINVRTGGEAGGGWRRRIHRLERTAERQQQGAAADQRHWHRPAGRVHEPVGRRGRDAHSARRSRRPPLTSPATLTSPTAFAAGRSGDLTATRRGGCRPRVAVAIRTRRARSTATRLPSA